VYYFTLHYVLYQLSTFSHFFLIFSQMMITQSFLCHTSYLIWGQDDNNSHTSTKGDRHICIVYLKLIGLPSFYHQ